MIDLSTLRDGAIVLDDANGHRRLFLIVNGGTVEVHPTARDMRSKPGYYDAKGRYLGSFQEARASTASAALEDLTAAVRGTIEQVKGAQINRPGQATTERRVTWLVR